MDKRPIKLCVCFVIVIQLCSGIYIQVPTIKPFNKVGQECPYDCSCNYDESSSYCDNGFSLSSLTDRTFMYSLKSLSIRRVEDVLLHIRLDEFTSLENLDLSSNVITILPEFSFKSNERLTDLKLSNNYIHEISVSTFSSQKDLTSLDLSHNNIRMCETDLFDALENLVYLNLSKNAITSLPLGVFKNQKALKVLDLSSNNMVYVTVEMLLGPLALQALNISRNNLVTISKDVASFSDHLAQFIISKNNFDCSCELEPIINKIIDNPLKFGNPDELICNRTYKLIELENQTLPCHPPRIEFISNSSSILTRHSTVLQCQSNGRPSSVNYWTTPLGINFSKESVRLLLRSYNITTIPFGTYKGCTGSLGIETKVIIQDDDSLFIDSMRGFLAGQFTCVCVNGIGSSNATVDLDIHEAITATKFMSMYIGAGCSFLFFLTGVIIGSISLCVQKCSCCCACCKCCSCAANEEEDKEFKFTVEDVDNIEQQKHSTLESCNSNDSYGSPDPPGTPFNSPIEQTPGASPMKCHTPNIENGEKSKSPNIKDTLDEVKVRLEKKMEKVRGHYHSIKESGSVYLTNIKDTGHQAKIKVKAGVVSGMEQVKFGVKSIKEFCGTGDMGAQTISALSFAPVPQTEVDVETDTGKQTTAV